MLLAVSAALAGQSPRFELTRKDLVAAGASFVNAWADYDGDGDLDLFVAFRDRANAMFRNDAGRFLDVAQRVGLADQRRTVGAVWFDHDEDGDLDVIVGNMDGDANGLFSQQNGKFTDVAATAGAAWGGRTPNDKSNGTVRPSVADVNGDGRLGKQYPDYLFRNTGTRFEDVTPAEIGSPNGDHGVQWADFDLDGYMDLALTGVEKTGMHWLLRNAPPRPQAPGPRPQAQGPRPQASGPRPQPPGSARAINLRLLDAAGRSTRAGAAVTIQVDASQTSSGRMTRLIDGGSGYNAQNDAPVHVVVPDAPTVTLVVTARTADGMVSTSQQQLSLKGWPRRIYEHRLPARQGERVVPVHQEPRHDLVFDSPGTRILDVQIPPGDTTLFHTHSDPILYVTMSTSRTRSQNIGEEWSTPAAPDAPGAPVSVPPGRMMSTTSYAERPQTHRVNNIGSTLFRLIGITNSSAGDDRSDPSGGFDIEPELSNRWFRGYRRALAAEDSPEHRHENPVAIVLVSGSVAVRTAATTSNQQPLQRPGAFVFLEAGATHVLRADAPDTQVVEVEVRRPWAAR
jgi:FG-GAP-like repeat